MRLILAYIAILVLTSLLGCPSPPICAPPVVVNCEYKTWPIERAPAIPGATIRRLDYPGIIGGVTQEGIDDLGSSMYQLFLWGSKNEATLEEINKLKK
jgi:hypothetical protein